MVRVRVRVFTFRCGSNCAAGDMKGVRVRVGIGVVIGDTIRRT